MKQEEIDRLARIEAEKAANLSSSSEDEEQAVMGIFANAYGQKMKNFAKKSKDKKPGQDLNSSNAGLLLDNTLNESAVFDRKGADEIIEEELNSEGLGDSEFTGNQSEIIEENSMMTEDPLRNTMKSKSKKKRKKGPRKEVDPLAEYKKIFNSKTNRNEKRFVNFQDVQNANKFSADLEFCGKGIDPGKFIIYPSSKFFNIIVVIKTVLLEVVIVSN